MQSISPPRPWSNIRLPENVRPSEYHLWLYPNLSSGIFYGRVTIIIDVTSVQSYIAVHIKEVQITTSKLTVNNEQGTEIQFKDCFEYPKNEFWICEFEDSIQPDTYKLYFEFNGKLTNKIVGFYRSTYKHPDGAERYKNFCILQRNFRVSKVVLVAGTLLRPNSSLHMLVRLFLVSTSPRSKLYF